MEYNCQSLLGLLSPHISKNLLALGTRISYAPNQIIHRRGETKPGLSIITAGLVMVGVGGKDGNFLPVTLLGPGECFGEFTLFTDLPRTHDISATEHTQIYQIPQAAFTRLHSNEPSITTALLTSSLYRTHQLLETVDALRRLALPDRALKTLLFLAKSSHNWDTVKCRQADLASILGVTRVSLSKALKQLVKEKLICLGYGQITLVNRDDCEQWLAKTNATPL